MKKRKFLTKEEVVLLLKASQTGKHGVRNHCLIFMAFRHGCRISELLSLTLSDIDMLSKQVYISRLKNGFSTVHPFDEQEFAIITKWLEVRSTYSSAAKSEYVFVTERNSNLSRKQAWLIIKKCGMRSDINIHTHPHMLRHACGYTLANEGADTRLIQDYLGHRNIRHTVRYTQGNSARFAGLLKVMTQE